MHCCQEFSVALCEDGNWIVSSEITRCELDIIHVWPLEDTMIAMTSDNQWYKLMRNNHENITTKLCEILTCDTSDIVPEIVHLENDEFAIRTNTKVAVITQKDCRGNFYPSFLKTIAFHYDKIVSLSPNDGRVFVSDGERIYEQYADSNGILDIPKLKIVCQTISVFMATIFLDSNGNTFFSIYEKDTTLVAKNVKSIYSSFYDIFALTEGKLHHCVVNGSSFNYCCEFAQCEQNVCVCDNYVWFSKDNVIYGKLISDHERQTKELSVDSTIVSIRKTRDSIVVSCESGNAYLIEYDDVVINEPVKIELPSKLRLPIKRCTKNARKV